MVRTDSETERRGLEQVLYDAHYGTAWHDNGGLNRQRAVSLDANVANYYFNIAVRILNQ